MFPCSLWLPDSVIIREMQHVQIKLKTCTCVLALSHCKCIFLLPQVQFLLLKVCSTNKTARHGCVVSVLDPSHPDYLVFLNQKCRCNFKDAFLDVYVQGRRKPRILCAQKADHFNDLTMNLGDICLLYLRRFCTLNVPVQKLQKAATRRI